MFAPAAGLALVACSWGTTLVSLVQCPLGGQRVGGSRCPPSGGLSSPPSCVASALLTSRRTSHSLPWLLLRHFIPTNGKTDRRGVAEAPMRSSSGGARKSFYVGSGRAAGGEQSRSGRLSQGHREPRGSFRAVFQPHGSMKVI